MNIIYLLYFITLPALLASYRIPYLGTGYDLKIGNPEGNSLFENEIDPGLKPTRFIILDDPSGSTWVSVLNNSMIREYLADDMIKYYRQIQDRWTNILNQDETGQFNYSKTIGGNCTALLEAKILLKELKSVMVTKEISKIYVEARLNYAQNFNMNPEFINSVNNLPRNLTKETRKEFTAFFKTWGTHVITEVSLGEKEIERNNYEERDYFNVFNEIVHDKQATTISTAYDPKFIPDILEELVKIPAYRKYDLTFGSKENPVPIRMRLEPIYIILSLVLDEKQSFIEIIQEAMEDYLMIGDETEFITREYSEFTNWPEGTFSLPKSIHGCPKGWTYGKRHHDTDNTTPYLTKYNENWINFMQNNPENYEFNFEFCSQTQKTHTSREWPKGSYCIYRYGRTCPSGFVDAKIYLDDEDAGNTNAVEGTLPEGVYGKDTMYYLCCRNDGDTFPLVLPYKSPFVLVPIHTIGCPRVFGMKNIGYPLWVNIDCNGEALTSACTTGSAADPGCIFLDHNVLQLWFCYYE